MDSTDQAARSEDGVRVEIYDQSYHMRGRLDPEYIRNLAQLVDTKMRSIAARTQTVDSLRVAVLAALNIADECHQLRTKCEAATQEVAQVEHKVGECSAALDELLEASRIQDVGSQQQTRASAPAPKS